MVRALVKGMRRQILICRIEPQTCCMDFVGSEEHSIELVSRKDQKGRAVST